MNDPVLPWNSARASSSPALDRSVGAADDEASVPTTSAAALPAGDATVGTAWSPLSASVMIWPPPEAIRALIQTM